MSLRLAIGALAIPVVSFGGTPSAPAAAGCPAATQVQLVRSLVDAFNAGNVRALNRLVAPEPPFQWFSAIGPDARLGKKAENRATLGAYIRRRHRHHDHLTLVRFGSTDDQGRIDLTLLIKRRADDYRPRNLLRAKQDAICRGGVAELIVWSM
jgi:hypothetical protein